MSLIDDVREAMYLRAIPPELRGFTEEELKALKGRTYVEGGGSEEARSAFGSKAKDRDISRLDKYEAVYEAGGPIAELVDIRANMIFGTGTEFVSDTNPGLAEWCDKAFRWRDKFFVDAATDSYVYGDAFSEHKTTRGGAYSREQLVQPQTVDKAWDAHGETTRWIQSPDDPTSPSAKSITLPPDAIAHYRLLGHPRKPWGVSLIGRAWHEVERYVENQDAISNSLRLHGYPRYHIKVGREGGQSIPDRILRLVRNRFNTRNWDEKTNWVTGADINIEPIPPADIKFEGITEHDLALLALAFGLPIEIANVGSDGLGTGYPAKARLQSFERKGRGQQTRLAEDFIEQVVKPTIRKFSPYPADEHIDIVWGDIVADEDAISAWLMNFKEYYTVDEVREKFGDAPFEGDEEELGPPGGADPMGGMFGGPQGPDPFGGADETDEGAAPGGAPDEEPAQTPGGGGGGGGGAGAVIPSPAARAGLSRDRVASMSAHNLRLFADRLERQGRALADVPPNAVSIGSGPAPEGWSVIAGPKGGRYAVPPAGGSQDPRDAPGDSGAGEGDEDAGGAPGGAVGAEAFNSPAVRETLETAVSEVVSEDGSGGFTMDADASAYDGLGYVVTVSSENFALGELSADDIAAFAETWDPVLTEFPELAKVGGFRFPDGDKASLDMNIIIEDERTAAALGEAMNQHSVWDMAAGDIIETGGTGEPVVTTPEEAAEFIREFQAGGEGSDPRGFNLAAEYGFAEQPRDEHGRLMSWSKAWTSPGRALLYSEDARDALWQEELVFLEMFEGGIWAEDTGKNLLAFSGGSIPDGVRENLLGAIDGGAIFGSIDSVPSGARAAVVEAFREAIESDSWTVQGIMAELQGQALGLTDGQAEAIARTEMASVVNHARRMYYSEREAERGEEFLYEWSGPQDHRTTDACEEAKRRTRGGVTMEELMEVLEDVSAKYFPDLALRDFIVHPFERHTYVRVVQ